MGTGCPRCCSQQEQGAPASAAPDQSRAEINLWSRLAALVALPHVGSQAAAPSAVSAFQTVAKDGDFQSWAVQTGGETRRCRKGCSSPSALPCSSHESGLPGFPPSHLKATAGKSREAAQSPASPGKPGTRTPERKTGTHRPRAQTLAGLGALWRERVENNSDLSSEMEGHCFSSSHIVHPNAKSISSFGSC